MGSGLVVIWVCVSVLQVEDDRNESQRLLAQERSARALQEEMLNSHLRKQQEIEDENRKNLVKSKEVHSNVSVQFCL